MQPLADVKVHSKDLNKRGINPFGQPIFRVVWAPSRIDKVLNKATGEIVELKRYEEDGWVLEKWTPAEVYAGNRAAYELAVEATEIAMEYPVDGEYEMCWSFDSGDEVDNAMFIAKMMNFDRENFTDADRRRAIVLKHEMDAKNVDKQKDDLIDRAMNTSPIVDVNGRAYSLPKSSGLLN